MESNLVVARSNLEDALALVRLGWLVILLHTVTPDRRCSCRSPACRSPGKHPAVPHGHHDGTVDEQTVMSWFGAMPNGNVGIVTGPQSRILVLDVDPRNGGMDTLDGLVNIHGPLPATVTARTGGGGFHFYFSWHEDHGLIPSKNNAWPGLDVKCGGGYVAAPPSTHFSLEPYTWCQGKSPWDLPLADPPQWILDRFSGAANAFAPAERPPAATEGSIIDVVVAIGLVPIKRGAELAVACPRHDDRHPSLRINIGKAAWYCDPCGAGGGIAALRAWLGHPEVEAIQSADKDELVKAWLLDEIGLPLSEIKRMSAVKTPWGPACVFQYESEDGVVVQRKSVLIGSHETWLARADVNPELYGLGELVEAAPSQVTIVATELDAHALRSYGVHPVVALPNGLRSALSPELFEPVARFEQVMLAVGVGRDADRVAFKLADLVGGTRCKRVRFIAEVSP